MKRILLIDDDEGIRSVFQRYLERNGYVVDCAAEGRQGLRMFDAEQPDLVITDIMMPDVDGLEVIMSIYGKKKGVPIIAVSGGTRAMPIDFLPMAKKFGARKVLYKPIELESLLAAVQEELG